MRSERFRLGPQTKSNADRFLNSLSPLILTSISISIFPVLNHPRSPLLLTGGLVGGVQRFGIQMKSGAKRPRYKGAEFFRRHFLLESRVHIVVHRNVQSNRHGHPRDKIDAVLYAGFNALTSRARQLRHNRRSLNRRHTVFGEVYRGMEVVDVVDKSAAPRDEFDNPLKPITMKMMMKE